MISAEIATAPMKTVLIIDDDSECRKVTGEILQQQGWEVLQAEDGEEGITLAKVHRPQLVLCDLLMPRGNGFQVCRTLRDLESLHHTRIVVMSGLDYETDRRAALAAGAHEYLAKPVRLADLAAVLSRAGGGESAVEKGHAPVAPPSPTRVKFWGVRGSVPTPGPTTLEYGGNTPCVEVRADGQLIILDAGTGLRLLGRELMTECGEQPVDLTLLLTHTHWDHIQGLPFFQPVYKPENRLRILGYEGARHSLYAVLTGQMETPFFPVGLQEVPANIHIEELEELNFSIGPVRVQACYTNHPGICVGYRLFASDGSVAYFPDNELRQLPVSASPPAPEVAREFARSENQKLADFVRGTDVLIMDAQYDCEEYKHHVGWGHGCLEAVVGLALQAEVKQLFLFHHDPEHDDARLTQMVARARQLVAEQKGALQVEAAREGAVVELAVKGVKASQR
jgi:phosphoribosyl 1,2-cyclic phosphodiesterase/ActR/RegA family two-component response regulator